MPARPTLVIQTAFLGDVILTTPLIAELARRGPVDVVVTPAADALLANNPHIRRRFAFDKRGRSAGIMGLSTAWSLCRLGHQVTVFDQDAVPNPRGASVDRHRLIRYPYGTALGYTRMVADA